jgi:hypothetical protein
MFNTIVRAGAIGAGAASRYGSSSAQMMRLHTAPALQHWFSPNQNIYQLQIRLAFISMCCVRPNYFASGQTFWLICQNLCGQLLATLVGSQNEGEGA